MSFAIVQATNVSLVYTIDAYRPVAGETVVTQLAFKGTRPLTPRDGQRIYSVLTYFIVAAFGFLLSFYTNPWIAKSGYAGSFGAMAGISVAILILWVPMYYFGSRIRHATIDWPVMKNIIEWNEDREVGE